MNVDESERERCHELTAYTLSHTGPAFIHQYAVDAFAAQTADDTTKPIRLAFALVGLCLAAERQYSGRNVQRVHTLLARRRKRWPTFGIPEHRGAITGSRRDGRTARIRTRRSYPEVGRQRMASLQRMARCSARSAENRVRLDARCALPPLPPELGHLQAGAVWLSVRNGRSRISTSEAWISATRCAQSRPSIRR
jgi:hypothetical protein